VLATTIEMGNSRNGCSPFFPFFWDTDEHGLDGLTNYERCDSSPQRRKGRRDVFSYSLPLIRQKYRRTGRTAKNKRALFLKIIKPLRSLRLCGE
jgi:hypothetical protein